MAVIALFAVVLLLLLLGTPAKLALFFGRVRGKHDR